MACNAANISTPLAHRGESDLCRFWEYPGGKAPGLRLLFFSRLLLGLGGLSSNLWTHAAASPQGLVVQLENDAKVRLTKLLAGSVVTDVNDHWCWHKRRGGLGRARRGRVGDGWAVERPCVILGPALIA